MAAEQLVRLRVDHDEFAVAPGSGTLLIGILISIRGVAHGFQLVAHAGRKASFEVEAVGQVLVMEAGRVGSGLDVEVIVDDGDDVVRYGGDDG